MLFNDLHSCIASGNIAGAMEALASGADPNAPGPDGLLALQCSCLPYNASALAKALCNAGANPLLPNPRGAGDLLDWACSESHWQGACAIAACLPQSLTASHCSTRDRYGASIATGAAAIGDLAALRVILATCPRAAQALDNHGADPFWHACESASARCAALLAPSCDLDLGYPDGSTPAHMAAKLSTPICLDILIRRGARCHAFDEKKRTPLHCAAFGGSWLCAALAIESGAPLGALDDEGLDAYSLACSMGHGRVAAAILAAMESQALSEQSEGQGGESSSSSSGRL